MAAGGRSPTPSDAPPLPGATRKRGGSDQWNRSDSSRADCGRLAGSFSRQLMTSSSILAGTSASGFVFFIGGGGVDIWAARIWAMGPSKGRRPVSIW